MACWEHQTLKDLTGWFGGASRKVDVRLPGKQLSLFGGAGERGASAHPERRPRPERSRPPYSSSYPLILFLFYSTLVVKRVVRYRV